MISRSGSKGAIFAIDSAVAVTLAIIIIAAASYFATYSEGDPMAQVQLYKTGQDIAAVMDYQGLYERFSAAEIANFINATIPSNMHMQLQLTVYNASLSSITSNPLSASINTSIIYGDRITIVRNEPAMARFAIWQ